MRVVVCLVVELQVTQDTEGSSRQTRREKTGTQLREEGEQPGPRHHSRSLHTQVQ